MADTVVNTFDLYNTTRYWTGYNFPGYTTEQQVTSAYAITQFSSSPYGSQVDFFLQLAEINTQNVAFQIPASATILSLPYLWGRYWWDKAVYYSNVTVYNTLTASAPDYYQPFSESVGTLYYLSRTNNLQNTETKPYSTVLSPLINTDISEAIDSFYQAANNLFLSNITNIGPGTGTDTNPGSGVNGTLIQADTDLERRITSNFSLTAAINELYPKINRFLPFNTNVLGNQLTPYYWSLSSNCEGNTINIDFANRNISMQDQITLEELIAR